jgi:hypothetical protein
VLPHNRVHLEFLGLPFCVADRLGGLRLLRLFRASLALFSALLGFRVDLLDLVVRVKQHLQAHGTSLTAAECGRMIPQLSAASIRQAMRWAGDERRLAQACQAVLEFML